MSTAGTPRAATSSAMPGAASPWTSFTRSAPASSAARATSGLEVSTEMGSGNPGRGSRAITGTTRRISSSAGHRGAPGRVDSPADVDEVGALGLERAAPAPPRRPGSAKRPPSEKESGVTLTTPMRKGPAPRGAGP